MPVQVGSVCRVAITDLLQSLALKSSHKRPRHLKGKNQKERQFVDQVSSLCWNVRLQLKYVLPCGKEGEVSEKKCPTAQFLGAEEVVWSFLSPQCFLASWIPETRIDMCFSPHNWTKGIGELLVPRWTTKTFVLPGDGVHQWGSQKSEIHLDWSRIQEFAQTADLQSVPPNSNPLISKPRSKTTKKHFLCRQSKMICNSKSPQAVRIRQLENTDWN